MTNRELIEALEGVPEKRLRLVELARALLGPGGAIDEEACSSPPLVDEINTAVEEAHAYAQQTRELRWSLQKLLDR